MFGCEIGLASRLCWEDLRGCSVAQLTGRQNLYFILWQPGRVMFDLQVV